MDIGLLKTRLICIESDEFNDALYVMPRVLKLITISFMQAQMTGSVVHFQADDYFSDLDETAGAPVSWKIYFW